MEHNFSSGPQASWGRVSSPPSELLPHKLFQSDDCWMPSDRTCICSAVNYSASSIFTYLREVWKSLASPLSAAPAVSNHQSLASQQPYFLTDYSEPWDKVFLTWSKRSAEGRILLPFNWCPYHAFYQVYHDNLPLISNVFKHNCETTKQLKLSPRCHTLIFTEVKDKWFTQLLFKVNQLPFSLCLNTCWPSLFPVCV